jgi:hypothetical protein
MSYSVFFSIEAIGRTVDSASPESCSGAETISELFVSLSAEGDFFGLIDERGMCFQIRFEREVNPYLLEIPRPDLSGSYNAQYSFGDAANVLEKLPDLFPKTGFSRFEFLAWQ